MSALAVAPAPAQDPRLAGDVLAHLEAQLQSTTRLLQSVLAQGVAIRAQDVDGVVRQVAAFQAELERRARLEEDRGRLLARGLFCLSRSVGILAHAWEQTRQGGRNKGPIPRQWTPAYDGPPRREVPRQPKERGNA
jgi:citrate synthase